MPATSRNKDELKKNAVTLMEKKERPPPTIDELMEYIGREAAFFTRAWS
jgi:hypothetical protein